MSAIKIQTKIQIQRQTHRQIQRQRQIKGKPTTPLMYFWKRDDKSILNMICHRQGLENKNTNTNTNTKTKNKNIQRKIQDQRTDLCCYMFLENRWQNESDLCRICRICRIWRTCRICKIYKNWKYAKKKEVNIFSVSISVLHLINKHCQRHNGPEGWVHLAKVTSCGYITSSNTNLDHISSSESWLRIN